jgi:hypothetical protein
MRSDLNVDARSSSACSDSVQFGGYAAGLLGAFNVRGGGFSSLDSIDTSRTIVFPGFTDKASARFHGNVGQVFGEVGYGMAFGSVAVEPLAALAYVPVHDGSFAESGGAAALAAAWRTRTSATLARRTLCERYAPRQRHRAWCRVARCVATRLRRCDHVVAGLAVQGTRHDDSGPRSFRSRATRRARRAGLDWRAARKPSWVRSTKAKTRRPCPD